MPTYDYECPKCQRVTEHYHGMLDDTPILCEEDGEALVRVISGGSIWTQPAQRTDGFASISLPDNYPPAIAAGCKTRPDGQVIIDNPKKQVPEILAHPIAQRDGLKWDGRI
jgi:putative FmdB family regulatory protein